MRGNRKVAKPKTKGRKISKAKVTTRAPTPQMTARKVAKGSVALLCGMLEENGRVLFLLKKDAFGKEKIEMPCVFGLTDNPMDRLSEAFASETGVKAHPVHQVMEGMHNIGTEIEPDLVPVLVFEMMPDEPKVEPVPGDGVSACVWLKILEAKGKPLTKAGSWLLEESVMVDD